MSAESNLQTIFKYFEGCNSGDLDVLMSTLAPDVIHYFSARDQKPIQGAEHLARYWRKIQQTWKPIWRIDHALAKDEEVVIEWSCAYLLKGKQGRMMLRGSDWYVMRSGRIAEVRAYYENIDQTRDCELTGFPYGERGYLLKGQ